MTRFLLRFRQVPSYDQLETSLAKGLGEDWTSARRQERRDQQPIWSFVLLELLAVSDLFGRSELTVPLHALSRRVHTCSEISHVARYAAEANGARGIPPRAIGVDRALCSALVPLLLGTIFNWPRATIARGSASERYAYARTSAYTRVQKRTRPGAISESGTLVGTTASRTSLCMLDD